MYQSNECTVCCEHYTDEKYPVVLPCGHVFCWSCVQRLDNNCPIDRQHFAQSRIRRIYNEGETPVEETPEQKLQNVADFLTQLQQKNSDLESRDRRNQDTISDQLKKLDEQREGHRNALIRQAADFETLNEQLVEAHDAQMNQQRLVHEQEIKI